MSDKFLCLNLNRIPHYDEIGHQSRLHLCYFAADSANQPAELNG